MYILCYVHYTYSHFDRVQRKRERQEQHRNEVTWRERGAREKKNKRKRDHYRFYARIYFSVQSIIIIILFVLFGVVVVVLLQIFDSVIEGKIREWKRAGGNKATHTQPDRKKESVIQVESSCKWHTIYLECSFRVFVILDNVSLITKRKTPPFKKNIRPSVRLCAFAK